MDAGVRLNPAGTRAGRTAWLLAAAVLAVPAAAGWTSRALALASLAWQPQLAFAEPWRWWSAAWVHLSLRHLLANLAGALLVTALGWVARLPRGAAFAWLAAWPLTHLALLLQPALERYAGLSGVLHAGVAVAAVHLLLGAAPPQADRGTRAIGGALLAGLALKIALEAPWQHVLIHPPQWDIAVAPLAHATGAGAGSGLALLALGLARWRARAAAPIPQI